MPIYRIKSGMTRLFANPRLGVDKPRRLLYNTNVTMIVGGEYEKVRIKRAARDVFDLF
jgi:hypothetical protein